MNRLKLLIPFFVFMILSGLFFVGLKLDPNELPSVLIGKVVPEFSLPDLDNPGVMMSAADLNKGEPYLLNVWATWCPTCMQEHPYLTELAKSGVAIYGINYKDDPEKARQLLKREGNPYRKNIVDEEGGLIMSLGVYGAPETFVVDAQGIIRYKLVGELNAQVWSSTLAPIFYGQ